MSGLKNRVVLVGVGGPTCSGKTTLAKHLQSILPNSIIIHQDDFAPPEELIPVHPVHKVPDWDSAEGAIDWPRLRAFLKDVKERGEIPPGHKSHDHMNQQQDIPLTNSAFQEFRTRFHEIEDEQKKKGVRITWGLLDGFLLYWDKEVIDHLDVRFFLRVPNDILKDRRSRRNGYFTAVLSNPEGSLWNDPPMYWENIVYPAYVEAHQHMFENGDIDNGRLTENSVPNLVAIEPTKKGAEMSMDAIVGNCCDVLYHCAHTLE